MKKVLFLFAALFMTCTFTSCSDDDDDYKRMKNLDVSLLPGYWIIVKDGAKTRTGIWFTYEPTDRFDHTEGKLICSEARYFSISDDMSTIVD
jgi:hypothetical protein